MGQTEMSNEEASQPHQIDAGGLGTLNCLKSSPEIETKMSQLLWIAMKLCTCSWFQKDDSSLIQSNIVTSSRWTAMQFGSDILIPLRTN